jgi:MoaA/NifB/PqqE/SkfB family radical SAM enzyme
MSNQKFFCPLPIISLSLEAGLQRRICCHDTTQEIEDLRDFIPEDGVQETNLNKKIIECYSKGLIPKNCEFCFNLEKHGNSSPRLEYLSKFPEVNLATKTDKIKYLDLTVDNKCNLKCRSCRPSYSNLLVKEFDELGIPYDKQQIGRIELIKSLDYIRLLPHLEKNAHITITGGEPFFSKNTKDLLFYLIESGQSLSISLRIFTNLTILPKWFEEIIDKYQFVELILSLDGSREIAEYIRHPSKWNIIIKNLETLSNLSRANLVVKIHFVLQVYNILSIANLINDLIPFQNSFPIVPEVTKLTHPSILRIEVLPKHKLKELVITEVKNLNNTKNLLISNKYKQQNIKAIDQIINLLESSKGSEDNYEFIQFLTHTKKIDSKRKQSLKNIIPYIAKTDQL